MSSSDAKSPQTLQEDEPTSIPGELIQSGSRPGVRGEGGFYEAGPPSSGMEPDATTKQLVDRLTPGTLIDNKYEISSVIGIGGMGVVTAAHHRDLGTDVALKFLSFAQGTDSTADLRARFRREARISAKLRNEHITRVLDVGTWENTSYIVMEKLDGVDLRHKLKASGGLLPLDVVLNYVLQVCEGMAEAHAAKIVHRDLKPANLFLARHPDGRDLIKIMDFGISKWTGGEEIGEITKEGTLLGSPKYMSPEQIFGSKNIDARADLWSIGAIFYEMASGRLPYPEPTLTLLCAALIEGPPKRLDEVRPGFPPRIADAIAKCFARDINQRYQSVAELAGALLDAVDAPGQTLRDRLSTIISVRGTDISDSGSLRINAPRPSVTGVTGVSGTMAAVTPPGGPRSPQTLPSAPSILGLNAPDFSDTVAAPSAPYSAPLPKTVEPKSSKAPLFALGGVLLLGLVAFGAYRLVGGAAPPAASASQGASTSTEVVPTAAPRATDAQAKPEKTAEPAANAGTASPDATASGPQATTTSAPGIPKRPTVGATPGRPTAPEPAPTTKPTAAPHKDPKGDDDIPALR